MIVEHMKDKIREVLFRYPEVAAAYVFGSTATGRRRRGSDVDVAVMIRGAPDPWRRMDMERDLSVALGADVDLVVFAQSSSLLQHEILRTGILIYEKDPQERIRQTVIGRRRYLDEQRLPRWIHYAAPESKAPDADEVSP